MSEKEFQLYLSLLGRFLRLRPGQRREIADELRDHLEERLEELSRRGLARDEAVRRALEEFGDAAELAAHFTQLAHRRRRRFLMRLSLGSIAAVTATILITSALWPPMPAVDVPPHAVAQQQKPPAREPGLLDGVPVLVPEDEAPNVRADDQQAAVEAKLDKRIEQINFDETPLKDALEFISDQIKVDILVTQKSLNYADITLDDMVTLTLKHTAVTAETALELILERAAGDGLTFRIRDGFIYVQSAVEN